jgi:hypothetical protein
MRAPEKKSKPIIPRINDGPTTVSHPHELAKGDRGHAAESILLIETPKA